MSHWCTAASHHCIHCLREYNKTWNDLEFFRSSVHVRHSISLWESKGEKIRNRYNQVPHLTQDTNGKVGKLQLETTNESQVASPFPAGDHKAQINRCTKRQKNINDPQKKYRLGTVSKNMLLEGLNRFQLINASSPRTYKSRYKKEIKQR